MGVTEVGNKREWNEHHQRAAGRAVVVDFTATWCGPCKAVAPVFHSLSSKFPQLIFLKVDVDACSDIAAEAGVRAMPTFQIYQQGRKVEEVVGANVGALEALLAKYKASSSVFQGQGRKLSDAPAASTPQPALQDSAMAPVDESRPTTTLQIRLADGLRITGLFNHTHTVGDVQKYIRSKAGGSGVLMTAFPPKPLMDESATLEQAGLLNSALIVKP